MTKETIYEPSEEIINNAIISNEEFEELYKEFFFEYDRSPVLIVNSNFLELQSNKKDYDLLLEKLLDYFNKPEGAKMYFNPTPTLI